VARDVCALPSPGQCAGAARIGAGDTVATMLPNVPALEAPRAAVQIARDQRGTLRLARFHLYEQPREHRPDFDVHRLLSKRLEAIFNKDKGEDE
jgi:hypothetical protein